ncbi:MAG: DUF4143 domain-containing protein [Planctomycetes bacterium]|nr:DUF4143 domain-containing protein [Planctomycetota bacterium]
MNYEGIASDAGVPARTVAGFFEVLADTLVGFPLPAFAKTRRRKAIKRSKFYLFDVGVAGAMAGRGEVVEGSELFGKALEHFLIQKVRAYLGYKGSDLPLFYWRSTTQQEVDLIIGEEIAVGIKATRRVGERHLRGLKALQEERGSGDMPWSPATLWHGGAVPSISSPGGGSSPTFGRIGSFERRTRARSPYLLISLSPYLLISPSAPPPAPGAPAPGRATPVA